MLKYLLKEKSLVPENHDFFQPFKKSKKNHKKSLMSMFTALMWLQFILLMWGLGNVIIYKSQEQDKFWDTYEQYKQYETKLKNKDYKEANYSLYSLLNNGTYMGSVWALKAVHWMQLNEQNYPDDFKKESLSLVNKYYQSGYLKENKKFNELNPCFKYDMICKYGVLNALSKTREYMNSEKESINEDYYKVTHLKEYNKYYSRISQVKEYDKIPTPYSMKDK